MGMELPQENPAKSYRIATAVFDKQKRDMVAIAT